MDWPIAISRVVFGLGIVLWVPLSLAMLMAFDDPSKGDRTLTVSLALSVWTYPLTYAIGTIGKRQIQSLGGPRRKLLVFAYLPGLNVAFFVAFATLIILVCDGQFVCR